MEAFATVEDLELRWNRTFTTEQIPVVEARLMDATAYISSRLDASGVAVNPEDEVQQLNLVRVCCDVARRSLAPMLDSGQGGGNNFAQVPLKGYMQTAGAFTEQFTFENPMGDLYLLKGEEKALGIGGMRFKTIPVRIEGDHVG